jgi:hypothetical protein
MDSYAILRPDLLDADDEVGVLSRRIRKGMPVDEAKFDSAMMARLAKALAFICGAEHAVTTAVKAAAESGNERDIKKARQAFLKLKHGDRQAALTMLSTDD